MVLGDAISERSGREVEDAEREAVHALARQTSPDEAAAFVERGMVVRSLVTFGAFIAFGALPLLPHTPPETRGPPASGRSAPR